MAQVPTVQYAAPHNREISGIVPRDFVRLVAAAVQAVANSEPGADLRPESDFVEGVIRYGMLVGVYVGRRPRGGGERYNGYYISFTDWGGDIVSLRTPYETKDEAEPPNSSWVLTPTGGSEAAISRQKAFRIATSFIPGGAPVKDVGDEAIALALRLIQRALLFSYSANCSVVF